MNFTFRRSSIRSTTSTPSTVFIGETADLQKLSGNEIAVVLGDLVIMNLDEPPQEGSSVLVHVPQPTRESRRRGFSLSSVRQTTTRLYISIHPALAAYIEENPNSTKFILAADAMLALSAQIKEDTLLLVNGYEAADQTFLDTYLFQHGQLVRLTEALIKPSSHPRYHIEVRQQIDAAIAEYPDARVVWTAPLTSLELDGIPTNHIDASCYAGKHPPVTHDGRTSPPSPKFPALATAVILASCVAVGFTDATTMMQKRNTYDELTRQATVAPSAALEILQTRAQWQQETDQMSAEKKIAPAATLMTALVQHPEWRLTAIDIATARATETIPSQSPPSETALLSITLSTPFTPGTTAAGIAQPLVAALNKQTGMRLVVKPNGLTSKQDGRLSVTIVAE